ncbi:metallophosphoesterase, partial [Singulisphaera rosea]
MNERRKRRLVAYAVILGLLAIGVAIRLQFASRRPALPGTFLVLPYVQWGEESRPSGVVTLLWQTEDRDAGWSVEVKAS